MVVLKEVQESNVRVYDGLPPQIVAVFVGATSGIGEYTLKALAKHANQPKVYFVGRSQEAGQRIKAQCEAINPQGEFTFIQSDVALMKNVDDVCQRIKAQEDMVNLLVLSQGTLAFGTDTEEGLRYASALLHYSRFRFTLNLLPLLRKGTGLRRVVSVFVGTKEGHFDIKDMQGRKTPLKAARGHAGSITTLGLEALAKCAPQVSFIHAFPGFVKSGITRGTTGFIMGAFKIVSGILEPFFAMDVEECGERHLFLCTSTRYADREGQGTNGVKCSVEIQAARATDGKIGGGVYSVDENGESAGHKIESRLKQLRDDDYVEKIWQQTMADFQRISGSGTI